MSSRRQFVFSSVKHLIVAGRDSNLSKKQIEEVQNELQCFHPEITFERLLVKSTGDLHLEVSLRTLDKTDFFTKEIDNLLLDNQCRVAMHSAKDLPEPIPKGLAIVALTKGVDSADSLVFAEGRPLPSYPRIGSSAERRDATVKMLFPNAVCCDIRGTIDSRLEQLDRGLYDAVVMAEAALIRLGLTHRNRLRLPGPTAPKQGRLAVLARADDLEMQQLFSCIQCCRKVLYLGSDPSRFFSDGAQVVHLPILNILPKPVSFPPLISALADWNDYSHLVVTSKHVVQILSRILAPREGCMVIAIGRTTAMTLEKNRWKVAVCASEESQEGILAQLRLTRMERKKLCVSPKVLFG